MWILYQIGLAAALTAAAPLLLARRGRHYLSTLSGRLARHARTPQGHDLWIHAVSVGEVAVARTLVAALPPGKSLLVTTVTPTGQARAREGLGHRATVTYLPFDLGFTLRRFFSRLQPASLILVESELWPLLLRTAGRHRLPVYVVNGRISDRSYRRMRRLRRFIRPLLEPIRGFGMQTGRDRDRLLSLGIEQDRVTVTGNLKYESAEPPRAPDLERLIDRLAAGRPLIVAGSTMHGEEPAVLDAFEAIGAGSTALLLLGPRHPERFDAVAEEIERRGLRLVRRSTAGADDSAPEVLLLDTLGELAATYRLATACFIGGTLVPTGGHNPLEAARFGKPIAVGPSMHNFEEMAELFARRRAWVQVGSSRQLAAIWRRWLDDSESAEALGQRARTLFEDNRGSLARTVELLRPLLDGDSAG